MVSAPRAVPRRNLSNAMLLFIDTEFETFGCPVQGLISIGCVTERGEKWYGLHRDYSLAACSPFVVEHVQPFLLEHAPDALATLPMLGAKLADWLDGLGEDVSVVVDYIGDWYFFIELLAAAEGWPARLARRPVGLWELVPTDWPESVDAADQFMASFFEANQLTRHNALSDAMANREFWLQAKAGDAPECAG